MMTTEIGMVITQSERSDGLAGSEASLSSLLSS